MKGKDAEKKLKNQNKKFKKRMNTVGKKTAKKAKDWNKI